MTAMDKFVAKRSHMLGFADGVETLLSERRRQTAEVVQEERAAACPEDPQASSVALVLQSKDKQVQDWYDTRYGHLRSGRGRRLSSNGEARSAGRSAGRSADLGSSRLGARKALGR